VIFTPVRENVDKKLSSSVSDKPSNTTNYLDYSYLKHLKCDATKSVSLCSYTSFVLNFFLDSCAENIILLFLHVRVIPLQGHKRLINF